MEKIVFVANISKPASEIFNSLSRKYGAKILEFSRESLLNKIVEQKPALVVVYSKAISHGEAQFLRSLLSNSATRQFPVLFIGSKDDYHKYVAPWNGNLAGIVLTPALLSTVTDKVDKFFENFGTQDEADENSAAQKNEEGMNEKRQILIVDDDPVILRSMVNILRNHYRTLVAKSGTAAISLLGTQKPDLILLDYMMPVCDGLQTLQMIRSEENTKDIPIFFLTGVRDTENVKNAMALKPEGYILKSTEPDEILKRIGDFFANIE